MSYGSPDWQGWVIGEEEGITHIKTAYDLGINAFDTSNVRLASLSVELALTRARFRSIPTVNQRGSLARPLSSIIFLEMKSSL
jgi:hypothetical protein